MYKYIIILLNINNSYNVRVHIYYKHSAILQQNIHKQTMFRSIFDTIVGTISSMNPLTHFIRYALDKTLNQFLRKKLTLEDFKNGPLNLQNIEINTQKINKQHLVSSPYIMHSGIIGNLRIILPPLTDLSTQSIEISVSGVIIVLKPNKKFAQNFKQKMLQLQEMQKYYVQQKQVEGQISQTGPVDFFKQLLKKIIMNIKVNISNIVVKLYMNAPSQQKSNSQFYLMLRIPLIYLDKKQDKIIKKNEVEELSFNILLPQITVHLMAEDTKNSQYSNMKYESGDFPFKYPTANHPKTILVIGSANIPDNANIMSHLQDWKKDGKINSMKFTQIGFKLTTDYKKKIKQKTFNLQIANIQLMVNAVQIKILSRFVKQITKFKKILDSIMQQVKFEVSESINVLMRKRSNNDYQTSQSSDLFTSIMMSFNNQITGIGGAQRGSMSSSGTRQGNSGMFKSMMRQDKNMRQSVRLYNIQFQKKLKNTPGGTQTMTMEFQAIQFKQSIKINMEFTNLTIYVLKYTTNQEYLRIWGSENSDKTEKIVNKKIGCDYFMFVVKKVDVSIKAKQKLSSINIKSLNIYNVKLHDNRQVSADSFYQIGDSVDFQAQKNPNFNKSSNLQIAQFTISNSGHFCVQQIVAISQQESEPKIQQPNILKYSLIPKLKNNENEDAYILYEPAVSLHLDNKQNNFKVNLKVITIASNLEVVLDLLNIVYPLIAYKRLAAVVNFKRNYKDDDLQQNNENQHNMGKSSTSKKNIFESMYEYRADIQSVQQLQSQNKNTLIIEVLEMKIGFRKGEVCQKDEKGIISSNFGDLIRKQKQKLYQEQAFNKVCYCNINEMGVYLELQNLKLQKKLSAIKLSCKLIDIGMMKISKSSISGLYSILSIKPIKSDDYIRILKQNTHCQMLMIYVPELNARFSEEDIINVAALAVDSIKIIGNLITFKQYLQRQMLVLEHKLSQPQKKTKKSEGATQKQIKIYIQKVFLELDYCSILIQQIYLNMNQQMQQVFSCKISRIVGGLNRQKNLKLKLCSFSNDQMLTRMYPEEQNNHHQKLIKDGDVFIEIRDGQKNNIVFKVQQRHAFFQKLEKHNFSFVFKHIKRDLQYSQTRFIKKDNSQMTKSKFKWSNGNTNGSLSQKFKFKHVSASIQQQGQKKIFIAQISKQIKIYACNLLELKNYKQKIQKFTGYLKNKIKEAEDKLKSQTMLLIDRKHSAQIQSESVEIIIKIIPSVYIDIRPDFIRNDNQRIFGNTRSILAFTLHNNLSVLIHKDNNQKQISGQFSLAYHFLQSDDRQIEINPLLLKQDQHLTQLGFKNVLQINRVETKININQNNKTFHIKIKSILGQASLQTLALIKLHFQHVMKHHVKNQMGIGLSEIYDGDNFCVLEYDADTDPDLDDVIIIGAKIEQDEDLQIQDLTGALQIYQQKLNRKKNQQQILRTRSFTFQTLKTPQISLEQLSIGKIYFRISPDAKDFDFIKFHGNQSASTKRVRVKEVQDLQYYVIGFINLNIRADIMSDQNIQNQQNINNEEDIAENKQKNKNQFSSISSLIKLQKVQIYYGKQKNYGYSTLKYLQSLSSQSAFMILNNETQLCIIFQKNPHKFLIKTYCLKLTIGATTEILETLKKWKIINNTIEKSGWRKLYDPQPKPKQPAVSEKLLQKHSNLVKKDTKQQRQRIVIMLPESTIKLTFQYANLIKIMDEQTIQLKQLILNEQINDGHIIKQKLRKWAKNLAKNNLGSLLSGTALNLLVKLFSQIIAVNVWWISKLLGGVGNSQ